MKTLKKSLLITAVAFFGLATVALGQARVQVIHNSADQAAETVDVWLDDQLLIDDFSFRTASPFIDAPAGVEFTISIQPPNSTSADNPLWSQNYTLTDGKTYLLVANGIVSPSGYSPAPAFDIYVYSEARESAMSASNTDVLVFHGSTDAPVVDIFEVSAGMLVDDLAYSDYAGYLELPAADYSLQVRNSAGTDVVAQYGAPLGSLGLDGAAISVLASGFLNPGNNSGGEAFGLYVALADGGDLIALPQESISTARVQVIHNSADKNAQEVDVWLNDVLLIDNFAFRTATPFIDAPAGTEFTIAIQPANSSGPENALWEQSYTLAPNGKYILVANGIIDLNAYNPAQPFDVYVYDMGREISMDPGMSDVLVFHGSTDAPVVDIVEVAQGAGTIIDDMPYGEFRGYLELPAADYSLQVRNAAGTDVVAQYGAPLGSLGLDGAAISVLASGFLNPGNNSNGEAFGLYVALASGGDLIALPQESISTARVQVIHNSADEAAQLVDVWLNDILLIDDFAFRTATPFIDAPAGVQFRISILPPNSSSPENPIWWQDYTLEGGEKYVLVANGIVSPSGYEPAIPFNIYVNPVAREMASQMDNADVMVFHGSTDAPVVDIVEVAQGAGTIIDDMAYGEFRGYLELPVADYSLQVRDASGSNVVAQFAAPIAGLGLDGQALSVLASGFLNPEANNKGEAFGLYVALAGGGDLIPLPLEDISTARVQVIHNAADLNAAFVDVWIDDEKAISDFAFRTATPFVDAPAGTAFTISIAPPNSSSPASAVYSQTFLLEGGQKYMLIANGIVSPEGYSPSAPFDLYVYPSAREMSGLSGNTDVIVFHGATDAPIIDLVEAGTQTTVVDNLEYGQFAGYFEIPTANYTFEVTDQSGTDVVAVFEAPLAGFGWGDKAIALIASGFLNPQLNSDGPAFGFFVALPEGGQLIQLTSPASTARVQVIHNSADLNASVVDVWLDNTLLIDDFAFRTATPFIDAPAGTDFTIAIQPANSTSASNPLWSQTYNLADGGSYILIANGIVSATGYDPVEPFNIYVYDAARENGSGMTDTDVLVFHGSTDAPVVDIYEVTAGMLIDDLMYGEYAGYLELPTADYSLQVRNSAGTDVVAQYGAPLSTLGLDGEAISVIASGFLNPSANSNGEAFGLYVALATGGDLIALPEESISTARVQVIHNSADLAAAQVDVWLNDILLIDDFAFRTATPFIDAPAGEEFTIAIQPANSTSAENPLWSQNYTLTGGEKYILVANGIVSPGGYDPAEAFNIYVYPAAREIASEQSNTDVVVFHGSTDAPTVDIWETAFVGGPIIDDLMYGEFAGYLELATNDYVLEVRDESGTVVVATYAAPLASLGLDGEAISVLASGFLNPANNSNGEAFGLYVALAGGGDLIPLSIATSVDEGVVIDEGSINVYPNPARSIVNINYTLSQSETVSFEVYNMVGNKVMDSYSGYQGAGQNTQQLNISGLADGMYLLRVLAGETQVIRKIKVQK
jgi:hypothetical protein